MGVATIVETRLDFDAETHFSADDEHPPDQAVPMRATARTLNRHEVLNFADTLLREESGDQDVRIRQVQLLGLPAGNRWCDAVVSASRAIEDGSEHARGIEAGTAVPINGTVGAHQRDSVEVANDA